MATRGGHLAQAQAHTVGVGNGEAHAVGVGKVEANEVGIDEDTPPLEVGSWPGDDVIMIGKG